MKKSKPKLLYTMKNMVLHRTKRKRGVTTAQIVYLSPKKGDNSFNLRYFALLVQKEVRGEDHERRHGSI